MKIGIITWFSYENYGTKLQAIALYKTIRELGFDVEIVNFEPSELIEKRVILGLKNKIHDYFKRVESKLGRIIYSKDLELKHKRMECVVLDNCHLSSEIKSLEDYIDVCNSFDILVVGSDQIWNPNWFHNYYYANYDEIDVKRVSYAPSFGVEEIDSQLVDDYRKALNRFEYLSVREANGKNIIESITGKSAEVVLDPTMLMSNLQWDEMMNIESIGEDYICLYLLSDNIRHYRAAKKFAKKKNLKLKVIGTDARTLFIKEDKIYNAGPTEFLLIIKSAKYVLTDSYHAVIFSIIYNKEFYVFERFDRKNKHSQNSRIYQILGKYDLIDRMQTYNCECIMDGSEIQYEHINEKVVSDISTSMKYLCDVLK